MHNLISSPSILIFLPPFFHLNLSTFTLPQSSTLKEKKKKLHYFYFTLNCKVQNRLYLTNLFPFFSKFPFMEENEKRNKAKIRRSEIGCTLEHW